MAPPISSLTNPRVKELVKLRTRRARDRSSTFLIEGYRELTKALAAGIDVVEIYYTPDLFLGVNEPGLVASLVDRGAAAFELGRAAFEKVAYRDRPEGLLAVARQFDTSLDRVPPGGSLLLVVEAIEKPGNLGTMVRTADGAGVDAVVVADPTTDPFNPNAVRASIGSIFTVPVVVTETADALPWLRTNGYGVVATTPAAEQLLWSVDLTGPVALIVGSEQLGLSEAWLRGCDHAVHIPMAGSADSLNAAMAAGIALFEAVRQRST